MFLRLAEVDRGRGNNLNLVRLVLASLVVLSHCWSVLGVPESEPVVRWLHFGGDIGALAVFSFFFISGYLITRSAMTSADPARYVSARALRILPGLCVAVLLSVFLFGPLVSTLSARDYFSQSATYRYLLTMMMSPHAAGELPGVFQSNALHDMNVPLWTLASEWTMYVVTMLMAILAKRVRVPLASWAVVIVTLLMTAGMFPLPMQYAYKWMMFFVLGGLCLLAREHIRLLPWTSLFMLIATFTLIRLVPTAGKAMLPVTLPYFLLCVGFAPQWQAKWFSGRTDISYGIYIYGWPVQQVMSRYVHSPVALFAASFAFVVPIAILSWNLVERPALAWKKPRRAVGILPHAGVEEMPELPETVVPVAAAIVS